MCLDSTIGVSLAAAAIVFTTVAAGMVKRHPSAPAILMFHPDLGPRRAWACVQCSQAYVRA
jgi:hypothetical protein